jgi:hypothetical protein
MAWKRRNKWQIYRVMNAEPSSPRQLNSQDVATCAYLIWEKEGRPHGRDAEHWLQAEAILRAMRASDGKAAKAPAKTAAPVAQPPAPTRKRKSKSGATQTTGSDAA